MISNTNVLDMSMDRGKAGSGDDSKRLSELGYLCSAVSHHVINSFSSIVSNAEFIRTQGGGFTDTAELEVSGTAIIETALDASKVGRKLIDWARRATAVEGGQAGPESPVVDLNQLVREQLDSEMSIASEKVDWVLNLGPIPPIPGNAGGLAVDAGLPAAKRSRGVVERCGND